MSSEDTTGHLTSPARALLARLLRTTPPRFIVQETNAGCIIVTKKETLSGDSFHQAKLGKALDELLRKGMVEKEGPIHRVTERGRAIGVTGPLPVALVAEELTRERALSTGALELLYHLGKAKSSNFLAPVTVAGRIIVFPGKSLEGGSVQQATWKIQLEELLAAGLVVGKGGCRYALTGKGKEAIAGKVPA